MVGTLLDMEVGGMSTGGGDVQVEEAGEETVVMAGGNGADLEVS